MFALASVNSVYAQTAEVPLDSEKFNPIPTGCYETIVGTWVCEFDPYANQEPEVEVVIPEVVEEVLPEVVVEYPEGVFVAQKLVDMENPKTRYEADLKYYLENPPTTAREMEYFALLKNQATCQQGTQESEGIQDKRRFDVSTTYVNPAEMYLKSIEITGAHATLKKANEECIYQHTILEPVILGPEYLNRAKASGPQPYHAEFAMSEPFIFPSDREITEHDMIESLEDAREVLCNIPSSAELDYCKAEPTPAIDAVIKTTSIPYHKYQEYMSMSHNINESVRVTGNSEPIGSFIQQQGGYEKAIDAIKWKKHFDATNVDRMTERYDE